MNNVPYCDIRKEVKSISSCKCPNQCKDFTFADVEPEYQDAFGETNGYKPRERKQNKQKQYDGQMSLFEESEDKE